MFQADIQSAFFICSSATAGEQPWDTEISSSPSVGITSLLTPREVPSQQQQQQQQETEWPAEESWESPQNSSSAMDSKVWPGMYRQRHFLLEVYGLSSHVSKALSQVYASTTFVVCMLKPLGKGGCVKESLVFTFCLNLWPCLMECGGCPVHVV